MRRYTEQILSSTEWVDAQGTINNPKDLEKSHLHNILFFMYERRNKYWLGCKDVELMLTYKNGDEFFDKVIKKSTLWNSILSAIKEDDSGFNFDFEAGDY